MNILLNSIWTKFKHTHAWKKIDVMKLKKLCKKIFIFLCFIDVEKIEIYIKSLQNWLCKTVKKMISWKQSHELFKSYWDKKCNKMVNTMKHICKTFMKFQCKYDWKTYFKIYDVKQKIIQRVKTFEFRKTIGENIENKKKLWIFTKWIKNKNHLFKKLFKMPTLIKNTWKKKFQTNHYFQKQNVIFVWWVFFGIFKGGFVRHIWRMLFIDDWLFDDDY